MSRTRRKAPTPAARRRRSAGAAVKALAALAALALTPLLLEACFRVLPWRPAVDLLRDYYRFFHIYPRTRERCPVHGLVHMPGIHWEDGALNLRLRYTTGALAVDDCTHGFRLNGAADDAPVYGAVFGDSFSENIHLDDAEGWVSLLSRETGLRFVNVSLNGRGTSDHLRLARAYLPALRPEVLIVQVTANDANEDWQRSRPPAASTAPWRATTRERWERLSRRWPWRDSVLFATFVRWGLPRFEGYRGPPAPESLLTEEKLDMQRRNLEGVRALAKRHRARLVIVAFPPEEYLERLGLDAWCRKNGVPLIRTGHTRWVSVTENYGIMFDKHYNATGNRWVARDILEGLRPVLEAGGRSKAPPLPRDGPAHK